MQPEDAEARIETERHSLRTDAAELSSYGLRSVAPIALKAPRRSIDEDDAPGRSRTVARLQAGHVRAAEAVVVRIDPYGHRPAEPPIRMLHQIDNLILGQETVRRRHWNGRASAEQTRNHCRAEKVMPSKHVATVGVPDRGSTSAFDPLQTLGNLRSSMSRRGRLGPWQGSVFVRGCAAEVAR